MAAKRSLAQVEIEAKLDRLEPTSERYHVLAAARDFKASWVELGERLIAARASESYREWGYPSFEIYCRRELRIKSDTAAKLTRSYTFLRDEEPEALRERQTRELPPLEVVDLLSRARDQTKVSEKDLDGIRQEVFTPDASPTRSKVVRRLREIDPEAFKGKPRAAKAVGDGDLRKALLLAERLQSLLEILPSVSRGSISGVREVAAELREQFEQTRQKSA